MPDLEQAISLYHQTREACYKVMRENPDVLGDGAWLRNAIKETDIEIEYGAGHLTCWGSCRSSQTQDWEHFEFIIPLEAVYKEVAS